MLTNVQIGNKLCFWALCSAVTACRQAPAHLEVRFRRAVANPKSRRSAPFLWVKLAILGMIVATAAHAQVGVSSFGSPTYSQTIAVPPGIGGMRPSLGIVYSGGGVNGPLGHGWSLQGISAITRCPATRFADKVARGVQFDPNDKLCLDGQRLIQTDAGGTVTPAATFDASGKLASFPQTDDARGLATSWREYRTERDNFSRIRAYGIANGSDVNGPAYFKVWTKTGQIHEYGVSASVPADANAAIAAQGKNVIMVWALGRISDVAGNFIDFKYEVRDVAWGSGPVSGSPALGREWNPLEIQYTGKGTQAAANKVIFRYNDRALDRAEAYQQGSKNVSVRRLDAIDTYINSPSSTYAVGFGDLLVKRTKFQYTNSSATKRSRLSSIKECVDLLDIKCLPATIFNYSDGGNDVFTVNTSFNLSTTPLFNSTGTMGVTPIDFDGDGKTDLLRWSETPSQNQLWKSNGDGTFTQVVGFNLTAEVLYSADGCVSSQFTDVNGDGFPDLMRVTNPKSKTGVNCATAPPKLYTGNGSGIFTQLTIDAAIVLDRQDPVVTVYTTFGGGGVVGRTEGRTYYLFDVNNDGILDIVKTRTPAVSARPFSYSSNNTANIVWPPDTDLCSGAVPDCTVVYQGSRSGTFTQVPSNFSKRSLFRSLTAPDPFAWLRGYSYPELADLDSDGLQDIFADNGRWLTRPRASGAVDFEAAPQNSPLVCKNPFDFNGDGRFDCLVLQTPYNNNSIDTNTNSSFQNTASFNLLAPGVLLAGADLGVFPIDINGDGKTDILRWHNNSASNAVYISNGDGSFTLSPTFNLTTSSDQLGHSSGSTTFVTGDFLGNGTPQLLRLTNSPTAGAASENRIYVKADPSLPDLLTSVVSPMGLKTTLTYASLANSGGRYLADTGTSNAAVDPLVDVTIPSPVVVTVALETESGVSSSTLKTEYAYRGLKGATDGRGLLGFRQLLQQVQTPETPPPQDAKPFMTTATDFLLTHPYVGFAWRSQTFVGTLGQTSGTPLSQTLNTYCDTTSATNPDSASTGSPCATSARVVRPYARKIVQEGRDLDGVSLLPKVTTINTLNRYGDPLSVRVTTEAVFAGATQTYTKTTLNEFCVPGDLLPSGAACPNNITGDNWILGRLTRSSYTATAPNLLSSLPASVGSSATAAAVQGVPPSGTSPPINPAVLQVILQLLLGD
jgi:FG-GAP-like repeat/Salmonella virulence plasmid 65kDa B protein/Insecticide toxin TcdB middle/N-terminal region